MNDRGNIVIYQTKDGKTSIDVKLENETVWLTQAQMAELFQKDRTVIGRHINNVYREGELERDITCAKFAQVQIGDISHCFSCSNIKYIDNQLVTVIKIQMICKCKYKTI